MTATNHNLHGLIHRWDDEAQPLPMRTLRWPGRLPAAPPPPPWWKSGAEQHPFDFCGHVRRLLDDVVSRSPAFGHIRASRLLLGTTQARTTEVHGLQARITPLRFRGGRLQRSRRGATYQVQRYFHGKTEFLYLLAFCLPRYLEQDFDGKLITLFHELYHISPEFDGDLRRHHGRCCYHSTSRLRYDLDMARLARDYLNRHPDPDLYAFLRLNFAQLVQRHGSIVGIMVPRPKVVAVLE